MKNFISTVEKINFEFKKRYDNFSSCKTIISGDVVINGYVYATEKDGVFYIIVSNDDIEELKKNPNLSGFTFVTDNALVRSLVGYL